MHWSMITKGLASPSSELRDGGGNRLYATFTRIHYTFGRPLNAIGENTSLDLSGRIARFGAGTFVSEIAIGHVDAPGQAQLMSNFSRRGETGNASLLKGQPTIPPNCPIPDGPRRASCSNTATAGPRRRRPLCLRPNTRSSRSRHQRRRAVVFHLLSHHQRYLLAATRGGFCRSQHDIARHLLFCQRRYRGRAGFSDPQMGTVGRRARYRDLALAQERWPTDGYVVTSKSNR